MRLATCVDRRSTQSPEHVVLVSGSVGSTMAADSKTKVMGTVSKLALIRVMGGTGALQSLSVFFSH